LRAGAEDLITIIVPTRNRAHTLRLVAPSYFQQAQVSEIIFVSDAGTDDSAQVVEHIAAAYPHVRLRFITNATRQGASQSRNVGVSHATNEFILFCDDDESMQTDYAKICLEKLLGLNAGAVSGRRIYLDVGETPAVALKRFGHGMRVTGAFRKLICEYVNAAKFDGDLQLPITNAIILTRKSLLTKYPYDGHYARGNGYREESDFQMNLYVNGYDIWVTNDCHTFHLPMSAVRTGGQRTHSLVRIWWSIYYTRYFFAKYYAGYAKRVGLKAPRWLAVFSFGLFSIYRETFRVVLFAVGKWVLRKRQQRAAMTIAA
jgi:glycosyltransferase involved in cell wall biosynthesis